MLYGMLRCDRQMSLGKKYTRKCKRRNLRLPRTQHKRDETMRKSELKHVQEVLSKDIGNTMRRYLDKKLRRKLNER